MKVIFAALLVLFALALPAAAQESDETWETYTSLTNVIRFEYPAGWEIEEIKNPISARAAYTSLRIAGHDDFVIGIEVEELEFSRWRDFNLTRDISFESFLAEAVRWHWADYELVELGDRTFIYHAETQNGLLSAYYSAFLDTGILVTIIATSNPDDSEQLNQIAQGVATSLEYAGDFPVDPACEPLDEVYEVPVEAGRITLPGSSLWLESMEMVEEGIYRVAIIKDAETTSLNSETDCFGIPDVRFFLGFYDEPIASLSEIEESSIQRAAEEGFVISVEHITIHDEPALLIKSENDARFVYQYYTYIGALNDGYTFSLTFHSLPSQMQRWQDVVLQIAETIIFEPEE